MYQVADMIEAKRAKLGIVIYLNDGSKACLFTDDIEDAEWLTWEINDAIAVQSQSLFDAGLHDIGARWGELSKLRM